MFELHKNRIETDEGFSIVFGRMRFVYEQGGHSFKIKHEMLPSPKSVAIWSGSICELDGSDVPTPERDAILENIRRALDGVGYHVTLIDSQ